jgi:RES domain-containing protein
MTRHVEQRGPFNRVADPSWADPLDPSYARRAGGRWNPPMSFGVVYLNADIDTARANVARLFSGFPYGPEDLEPDRGPDLVELEVPPQRYVDALSAAGLHSLGLPVDYPLDETGATVGHATCQPIGARLYDDGELGVAARSAAPGAGHGRELAWFARPGRQPLTPTSRRPFLLWYWQQG